MTKNNSKEPLAHFEASISQECVEKFFLATGWNFSERPSIPPTIATIFREGEFQALQKLNIPLRKVLHGEQEYRFLKPLTAETKYSCTTFLSNQFEKSGSSGTMRFYVFQTDVANDSGDVFVQCISNIVVREGKKK